MKKQYVFLLLIGIIFYISFLIARFTYQEYEMRQTILSIETLIEKIKEGNEKAEGIIAYKSSKAFINKVRKAEQSLKNKGEQVLYIATEKDFNTFAKNQQIEEEFTEMQDINSEEFDISQMTIPQKWNYLLFSRQSR